MKEIKFRAFQKSTQKMLPVNSLKAICTNSERLTEEEYDDLIIMQFTGFKDKNGKEIFEGDICKVLYTDWISKSPDDTRSIEEYMYDISETLEVDFIQGSFVFKKGDIEYPLDVGRHGQIIIIGNIYENGELLNS